MSDACEWHRCAFCDTRWEDEVQIPFDKERDGCSEWHTCTYCEETVDVDPDTVPDFKYTVGRPDVFGGECHYDFETAKSRAATLSSAWFGNQRIAIKTRDDDGRPTVVAHLYEAGREIKETR